MAFVNEASFLPFTCPVSVWWLSELNNPPLHLSNVNLSRESLFCLSNRTVLSYSTSCPCPWSCSRTRLKHTSSNCARGKELYPFEHNTKLLHYSNWSNMLEHVRNTECILRAQGIDLIQLTEHSWDATEPLFWNRGFTWGKTQRICCQYPGDRYHKTLSEVPVNVLGGHTCLVGKTGTPTIWSRWS